MPKKNMDHEKLYRQVEAGLKPGENEVVTQPAGSPPELSDLIKREQERIMAEVAGKDQATAQALSERLSFLVKLGEAQSKENQLLLIQRAKLDSKISQEEYDKWSAIIEGKVVQPAADTKTAEEERRAEAEKTRIATENQARIDELMQRIKSIKELAVKTKRDEKEITHLEELLELEIIRKELGEVKLEGEELDDGKIPGIRKRLAKAFKAINSYSRKGLRLTESEIRGQKERKRKLEVLKTTKEVRDLEGEVEKLRERKNREEGVEAIEIEKEIREKELLLERIRRARGVEGASKEASFVTGKLYKPFLEAWKYIGKLRGEGPEMTEGHALLTLLRVGYEVFSKDRFEVFLTKDRARISAEITKLDPAKDQTAIAKLGERLELLEKFENQKNSSERSLLIQRAVLDNKISHEDSDKLMGKADPVELVGELLDGLIESGFAGLKELKDKNPEDLRKMSGEIMEALKIDDNEEFIKKLDEVIRKYNLTGKAKKSMESVKTAVGELHKVIVMSRKYGGLRGKEAEDAKNKLEGAKKEAFGIKEGLVTAGFIGGAILLAGFIAFIICLAIMEKMMNIKPPKK